MNLYKVIVETEIMVMANDVKEAVDVAKKNATNEIAIYGRGNATKISNISEIPNDWKSVIPYAPDGYEETRKCFEIVSNKNNKETKELPEDEIKAIIDVKKDSGGKSMAEEIRPETRPDPKPKELNWHDTKSGRPILRFVK